MNVTGILKGIDHFLNLQLKASKIKMATENQPKIKINPEKHCSIRGSSVKCISVDHDSELEMRVTDTTLLRFSIDK